MLAIKVENLSKAYQLGEIGTGTLSRDLERWFAKVRGEEDPFLRIGETNDRTTKSRSDVVWSLKDINFEIKQGDAVGIIGRNGAGKSTLLKILSRVTSPTTGEINVKGRIASLLEVGTGFHPELTGKENIYLNGAILGMRKKEIKRKFDEIVDFAGVERYIDTPVKRYSSGMYVRLAFAVAAYLESEILIVDEVLAVGDAEFQRKCLGKMGEVSKGEGRTVLFVSHNMASIMQLCNKGILLNFGEIEYSGQIDDVVRNYSSARKTTGDYKWENPEPVFRNDYFLPLSLYCQDNQGLQITSSVGRIEKTYFIVEGKLQKVVPSLCIGIAVFTPEDQLLFWSLQTDENESNWPILNEGPIKLKIDLPNIFNEGRYRISLMVSLHKQEWLYNPEIDSPSIILDIEGRQSESPYWIEKRQGIIAPLLQYKIV